MTVAEYQQAQKDIAEIRGQIAQLRDVVAKGVPAMRGVYGLDQPDKEPLPEAGASYPSVGMLQFQQGKMMAGAELAKKAVTPFSTATEMIRGNPEEQGTIENIARGGAALIATAPAMLPLTVEQSVIGGIERGNPAAPATDMAQAIGQTFQRQATGEAGGVTRGEAWSKTPVEEAFNLATPLLAGLGISKARTPKFKSIKEARAAIKDIGKPKVDVPEVVQEPIRSETPKLGEQLGDKLGETPKVEQPMSAAEVVGKAKPTTKRTTFEMTMYHGTDAENIGAFDVSDRQYGAGNKNPLGDNIGAFFTTKKESAQGFGKNVVSRKIQLDNPKVFSSYEDFKNFLRENTSPNDGLEWKVSEYQDAPGEYFSEGVNADGVIADSKNFSARTDAERYVESKTKNNTKQGGQQLLKDMGYDGVVIKNPFIDAKTKEVWAIAFDNKGIVDGAPTDIPAKPTAATEVVAKAKPLINQEAVPAKIQETQAINLDNLLGGKISQQTPIATKKRGASTYDGVRVGDIVVQNREGYTVKVDKLYENGKGEFTVIDAPDGHPWKNELNQGRTVRSSFYQPVTKNFTKLTPSDVPTTATEVVAKAKPNAVTKDVKTLTPEELTAAQARLREKFKPMDEVTKPQTPQIQGAKVAEIEARINKKGFMDVQDAADLKHEKTMAQYRDIERQQAEVRKLLDEAKLDDPTIPNMRVPSGYIEAKRQVGGKYKLFYRGTRNEVFQGQEFNSASDARSFYKTMQAKDVEMNQRPPSDSRAGKISTEPPTAVQDAAVRPAQSTTKAKEPWDNFKKTLEPVDPDSKGSGSWGISEDGSLRIKLMRSGSEFGDPSRGGTWYEVNSFEGKEPTYGAGKPWVKTSPGVGGKQRFDVDANFKNPLVVNIDNVSEAYYPIRAIKQLLGEEVAAKWTRRLKRNASKDDIERHFSKLESVMAEEAAKSGHDGVVFYYTLTNKTRSFPDQVFKIDPDLAAKYGKPTTENLSKGVLFKDIPKEKLDAINADRAMQGSHKWAYKTGDQVEYKHDKRGVVKGIVANSYVENGKPIYVVYPPGKKTSFGYHVTVRESELFPRGKSNQPTTAEAVVKKAGEGTTELHAGVNPFKIIDDYMTKRKLVNPLGTPEHVLSGKGIVEPFRKAQEAIRNETKARGESLQKTLEGIKRGSDEDVELFRKLNDPKSVLNEREQAIRNYLDDFLNTVNEHRVARGQDPVKYRKGYITHLLDAVEKNAEQFGEIPMPKRYRFQFEQARKNKAGYRVSALDAIEVYTKAALKDIHIGDALHKTIPIVESLGDKPIVRQSMVKTPDGKTINMTFYDWTNSPIMTERGYAESFIKGQMNIPTVGQRNLEAMFGIKPNTASKTAMAVTARFYQSLLGLAIDSSVKNLTQGINTMAEMGVLPTLKGYAKLATAKGLKTAKAEHLLEDFNPLLMEGADLPFKTKTARAIGKGFSATMNAPMKVAEFINRGAAYHAAYDVYIKKGMSLEQAHEAARAAVRKTQFSYSKIDTSPALRGPFARTFSQFFSYPLKQSEMMYKWATKPGEQGKLVRYFLYTGMAVVGAKYGGVDLSGVFFDPIRMVDPNSKEGFQLPGTDKRVKIDPSKLGKSGYTPQGFAPSISIPYDFVKSQMSDDESAREYGREKALTNIIPGGRYGKKVYDVITESDEKGKRDRLTRENTTKDKVLKLLGGRSTDREAESSRRELASEVEKKYYATRQKLIDLKISGNEDEFIKLRDEFRDKYPFLYGRLMKGFADAVKEERKKKGMTTDERFFDNSLRKQIDANL